MSSGLLLKDYTVDVSYINCTDQQKSQIIDYNNILINKGINIDKIAYVFQPFFPLFVLDSYELYSYNCSVVSINQNELIMYTKYENLLDNEINNYIIESRINKILKIKNTIDDKR